MLDRDYRNYLGCLHSNELQGRKPGRNTERHSPQHRTQKPWSNALIDMLSIVSHQKSFSTFAKLLLWQLSAGMLYTVYSAQKFYESRQNAVKLEGNVSATNNLRQELLGWGAHCSLQLNKNKTGVRLLARQHTKYLKASWLCCAYNYRVHPTAKIQSTEIARRLHSVLGLQFRRYTVGFTQEVLCTCTFEALESCWLRQNSLTVLCSRNEQASEHS